MKKRNKIFLVFSVLVFVMALLVFGLSQTTSTLRPADSDFALKADQKVVRVEIITADGMQGVSLARDAHDRWTLNDTLFANEPAVQDLKSALRRLTVRQPVSVANESYVRKMLQENATRVQVFVEAYRINLLGQRFFPYSRLYQSFWVGQDTPDGQSTYMQKTSSDLAFKVYRPGFDTGLHAYFAPHEKQWRDPVILRLEWDEIARIQTRFTDKPDESFVLKVESADNFSFYDPKTSQQLTTMLPDTLRVLRYLSSFNDLYYESLLDESQEEKRKKLMHRQPFVRISVESIYGDTIQIVAYARNVPGEYLPVDAKIQQDPNRFYLQVKPQEYALAQYYIFNRVFRPLSFFAK